MPFQIRIWVVFLYLPFHTTFRLLIIRLFEQFTYKIVKTKYFLNYKPINTTNSLQRSTSQSSKAIHRCDWLTMRTRGHLWSAVALLWSAVPTTQWMCPSPTHALRLSYTLAGQSRTPSSKFMSCLIIQLHRDKRMYNWIRILKISRYINHVVCWSEMLWIV